MEDIVIVDLRIIERTSKQGKKYTALYGYDIDGNEYFLQFVRIK